MFLPSPWSAEPHCSGKAETQSQIGGQACVSLGENGVGWNRARGSQIPGHPGTAGNCEELRMEGVGLR